MLGTGEYPLGFLLSELFDSSLICQRSHSRPWIFPKFLAPTSDHESKNNYRKVRLTNLSSFAKICIATQSPNCITRSPEAMSVREHLNRGYSTVTACPEATIHLTVCFVASAARLGLGPLSVNHILILR